jgi:hypothetical protein
MLGVASDRKLQPSNIIRVATLANAFMWFD